MSKIILSILTSLFFITQNLKAQDTAHHNPFHQWWHDRYYGIPQKSADKKKLTLIRVQGNKFVDENGKSILFKGLAIADPDKIENQGHWNKQLFEKLKEWGVMLVRIPVHPIAWRERTPVVYLSLLDQAVSWCTDLGIYIDIDWHSIGNLKTELFQDPMYNTSMHETFEFWRTISWHYSGNNTVAFYELFNEPTIIGGKLGRMTWDEWKKINEDLIFLIRAYDKEKIPLVAGLDWAYDLTPLNNNPINAEGIGYVTHPYAAKRSQPYEPKWEIDFGFAANKYPVLATEFGFGVKKDSIQNINYGKTIINYLENKGISWIAWVFDPDWGPSMIESWDNFKPTGNGEFFKEAMQDKKTK
jgi:aryl-phospho-beta-D-glucosidase BglC (GH1 family)